MSGKTSTFTIHHDRCHPDKWTALDLIALANFVRSGNLAHAADLSRLGVDLVMSEHHEPKGGTLEQLGWATAKTLRNLYFFDDLAEAAREEGDEIAEVFRIYRAPAEYAVEIAIGNEHGDFDGHEYEVKATLEEAQKLAASLASTEPVF